MTIYTKKGDEGFTHRPDGRRIRKSDPLCEVLGTIDELNCHLGLCLQLARDAKAEPIIDALKPIQPELMVVAALLAAGESAGPPKVSLDEESVRRMERQIDAAWAELPPLTHFILPGGSELSCRLHVARTVCRRGERCLTAAVDAGTTAAPLLQKYINRLSDLLFTLARLANQHAGAENNVWAP